MHAKKTALLLSWWRMIASADPWLGDNSVTCVCYVHHRSDASNTHSLAVIADVIVAKVSDIACLGVCHSSPALSLTAAVKL